MSHNQSREVLLKNARRVKAQLLERIERGNRDFDELHTLLGQYADYQMTADLLGEIGGIGLKKGK